MLAVVACTQQLNQMIIPNLDKNLQNLNTTWNSVASLFFYAVKPYLEGSLKRNKKFPYLSWNKSQMYCIGFVLNFTNQF